jgi:hypothetical protein
VARPTPLLEAWLEKDALSGIFADALQPYGVTFNVGRGFDSATSVKGAADRYGDGAGVAVLYFGDFDPSGEDMVRSFRERLTDEVEVRLDPEALERTRRAERADRERLDELLEG